MCGEGSGPLPAKVHTAGREGVRPDAPGQGGLALPAAGAASRPELGMAGSQRGVTGSRSPRPGLPRG